MNFELNEMMQELDAKVMQLCADKFLEIDKVAEQNSIKVLRAFIENRVSATEMVGTTGYGYDDRGRDTLDKVFATAVGAEDALCRPHFMSGTHALTVALFGMLRAGDTMLSITGSPYDTLRSVIGLEGEGYGSLREFGVNYKEIPLLPDGSCNFEELKKQAPEATMIYIQRSRGYDATRPAFGRAELEPMIKAAREANPKASIVIDNCYGEFCETEEPCVYGADLIVGSLIKNPGGGIADTGGYIAGKEWAVERCANRLTAPGTGREIGSWPAGYRSLYLGLFSAPTATASALKTGVYAACLMEQLGYGVSPAYNSRRSDITTAIDFRDREKLIKFVQGIQAYSPVDSFATPEPWEMPGYDSEVIMAAGAFTAGSSIELSCDAPVREPFTAYMQGGINFPLAKFAVLKAAERIM